MSDKNIEMMKKLIEEKKNKSAKQNSNMRADKTIGYQRKANRSGKKTGGVFDKG